MKKIIAILAIVSLSIISCKKDNTIQPLNSPQVSNKTQSNKDTILIKIYGYWVNNTTGFKAQLYTSIGVQTLLSNVTSQNGDTVYIKYICDIQLPVRLQYNYPDTSNIALKSKGMNSISLMKNDTLQWVVHDDTLQEIHPLAIWEFKG